MSEGRPTPNERPGEDTIPGTLLHEAAAASELFGLAMMALGVSSALGIVYQLTRTSIDIPSIVFMVGMLILSILTYSTVSDLEKVVQKEIRKENNSGRFY